MSMRVWSLALREEGTLVPLRNSGSMDRRADATAGLDELPISKVASAVDDHRMPVETHLQLRHSKADHKNFNIPGIPPR